MNNLISVIIPAFNEEGFILNTLESLKKQNFNKNRFEIIISDNGSKDKTKRIVLDYKKRNPSLKVKLVHESTPGVCLARNKGAAEATGDILIFLDADNIVYKNLLRDVQKQVLVEKYMAGTIYTMSFEKSFRGYILYVLLEIIKVYGDKPFGKSYCTKNVFNAVGGFNEDHHFLGTNLEYLGRIKNYLTTTGQKMGHINTPIYTSIRRFEENGYIPTLIKWGFAYFGKKKISYPPVLAIS